MKNLKEYALIPFGYPIGYPVSMNANNRVDIELESRKNKRLGRDYGLLAIFSFCWDTGCVGKLVGITSKRRIFTSNQIDIFDCQYDCNQISLDYETGEVNLSTTNRLPKIERPFSGKLEDVNTYILYFQDKIGNKREICDIGFRVLTSHLVDEGDRMALYCGGVYSLGSHYKSDPGDNLVGMIKVIYSDRTGKLLGKKTLASRVQFSVEAIISAPLEKILSLTSK